MQVHTQVRVLDVIKGVGAGVGAGTGAGVGV